MLPKVSPLLYDAPRRRNHDAGRRATKFADWALKTGLQTVELTSLLVIQIRVQRSVIVHLHLSISAMPFQSGIDINEQLFE